MHLLAMSKVDLQKHLLAFVLLASFAPYQVARAQQPLHFPSPELAIPGVAQKSPISAPDHRCIRVRRSQHCRSTRDEVRGRDTSHSQCPGCRVIPPGSAIRGAHPHKGRIGIWLLAPRRRHPH